MASMQVSLCSQPCSSGRLCPKRVAEPSADPELSVRRRPALALSLRRLGPPFEILGQANEAFLEPFAGVADRPAVMIESLPDRPDGERARNHDHAHLAQSRMPHII